MPTNLVEYLERCDDAYYNTSNPIVSDETYDALVETLRRLDPRNPYLRKVGVKVKSSKLGRLTPMGTLSKYTKVDDVREWLESESSTIILAPKYDGFAVELIYDEGTLVSASTRGDGFVGEDVLAAMMRVRNVPTYLPENVNVTVRGEVIIPVKHHDNIKSLGYSAMRNAVPGIVRSNRAEALQYVDYVAYEFLDDRKDRVQQRVDYMKYFTVEDYKVFESKDIEGMEQARDKFRDGTYIYELDGVVLKTRHILEDDLSHPSHMIAWKYESKLRETTLRGIEFNVGATGSISVVGVFDPVEFQGANLSRASFGSLDLYNKMRPAVGDLIEVSRRGDIIPWIEGVTLSGSGEYQELVDCPCCGTPLVDNKCVNQACPDRVKLKLLQYVQGMKVKGIGQSLVNLLVDSGMVKSLTDIYDIDADSILSLPRQGNSAVEKWKTLQAKRVTPLEFLCSYPIENAGKSLWESLLDRYSLQEIIDLDKDTLTASGIRGIGESKINSLTSQLSESRDELRGLLIRLDL